MAKGRIYQIKIKGRLGSHWSDWFEGLTTASEEDGDSLLTGPVIDDSALHGLLKKVVIALGPPQHAEDTTTRKVEIHRAAGGSLELTYSHEFTTNPPYAGDPSADTELSRTLVERFFEDVLIGHDLDALAEIASPNILIHPTAMPCEASYYGIDGTGGWLGEQWKAFPDLTISDHATVAQGDIVAVRWTARGTSKGSFLMLPPTGEAVEYTGVSMYRVEGGKIAEVWETRNTFGIMRQLNPEIGGDHHGH